MDQLFGYFFILSSIPLTIFLGSKQILKNRLIALIFIAMILIGTFLMTKDRVTKLVLGAGEIVLDVKKAEADIHAIDSLKTQILSDYNEFKELKANLNSGLEVNDGSINVKKNLDGLSHINMAEDGFIQTCVDMPVTDRPVKGTVEGYSFNIDSNKILIVKAEADGNGGISKNKVEIKGNVEIVGSENGLILTSPDGAKWLLNINNDGTFIIEKFLNK